LTKKEAHWEQREPFKEMTPEIKAGYEEAAREGTR
jgi:hypothetical protein